MYRSLYAKYYVSFFILLSVLFSCSDETRVDNGPVLNPEDELVQISVDTKGATIVDEPKVNAEIVISSNDELNYQGAIGIEFRGATSQSLFPKKSFGLETRDANNEDLDVALLGLPEEEDWILQGPYSDKSLMRNVLIYGLSRDMNQYASRTVFAELNVNDDYRGVYVFMEKLKRDKNRIAINSMNATDNSGETLTGGYVLKIDKTEGSNLGEGYNSLNSFRSSYRPYDANANQSIYFLYDYPDAEDITAQQKQYISSYMADFENALASSNFKDPIEGYAAYIDVDSFIDFFILNELSNNVDGYRLSTFMHKERNGKLKMGPIWDFNLAFGNANYCSGGETNVWAYKFNERCPNDFWLVPFWWERLLEDENFVSKLKERWNTLRLGVLAQAAIINKIDDNIELLTEAGAITNNFREWAVLGNYVWPNNFVGSSYTDETNYLKGWILERLIWLDNNIENL